MQFALIRCGGIMFLECGSKVYFQHIAFAQTLLNIVYHSHWCVLVSTHAGTHLFSIDCRHSLSFFCKIAFYILQINNLVVQLHTHTIAYSIASSIGGCTYIYIRYGRFLHQLGQFCSLRYLIFHFDGGFTHVGNKHKEEQDGENKVGQRSCVQFWNIVFTTSIDAHWLPPFCVFAFSVV